MLFIDYLIADQVQGSDYLIAAWRKDGPLLLECRLLIISCLPDT
jgi:hypothetical protein